jgi:hypothetical protein
MPVHDHHTATNRKTNIAAPASDASAASRLPSWMMAAT